MKKLNFNNRLNFSYVILIILIVICVTVASYITFKKIYVEVVNSANEQILSYIVKSYENEVEAKIKTIYSDYIVNGRKSFIFNNFFKNEAKDPTTAYQIYDFVRESILFDKGIVSAIHVYSGASKSIVSSRYGFKSGNDVERLISPMLISYQLLNEDVNQKSMWTVPYKSVVDNTYFLSDIYRVQLNSKIDGASDGFIAFEIDIDKLSKYINSVKNMEISIVNSSSRIICHPDSSLIGTQQDSQYDYSKDNGYFLDTKNDIVTSYTKSPTAGFCFVARTSSKNFYPIVNKIILNGFVIAIIFIFVGLVLAFFVSNYISRPINTAVESAKKLLVNKTDIIIQNDISDIVTVMRDKFQDFDDFISNNKEMIKNNLITCLYFNNTTGLYELDDKIINIGFSDKQGNFATAIIIFNFEDSIEYEVKQILINTKISEIENAQLSDKMLATQIQNNIIAVIANTQSVDNVSYTLKNIMGKIPCNIFLGNEVIDYTLLAKEFANLREILCYSFFYPHQILFKYSDFLNNINYEKSYEINLDEFKMNLNSLKEEQTIESIRKVLVELLNSKISYNMAQEELLKIVSEISITAKKNSAVLETFEDIVSAKNIIQFENAIVITLKEYFEIMNSRFHNRKVEIIEQIKGYIDENYDKDISLAMLSEYVNLHSAYISKLFRECTGENITSYIKDAKLNRSLVLLSTTHNSIESVAISVGYNTTHYFIKQFKEKYGVTPTTYRKRQTDSKS